MDLADDCDSAVWPEVYPYFAHVNCREITDAVRDRMSLAWWIACGVSGWTGVRWLVLKPTASGTAFLEPLSFLFPLGYSP